MCVCVCMCARIFSCLCHVIKCKGGCQISVPLIPRFPLRNGYFSAIAKTFPHRFIEASLAGGANNHNQANIAARIKHNRDEMNP